MYQQEHARPDCSNQGMHFHVHQCVCTSPLYNPYRQPLIAPYVAPPVARPYNLAHYQYTSYNIPYNVPVFNPNAAALVHPNVNGGSNAASTTVAAAATTTSNTGVEVRDGGDAVRVGGGEEVDDANALDASMEDFTKFLEQGCLIAEKIAIRNQHRPCFKNIQNLCNRTKNEILKPSHTVSNIHSQGIPWATKDFIYAYVRLINCWHMLKGYLEAKSGTLGNIDRELTAEFKTCYTAWEQNTKDLADHMIRIFSNLDNNVCYPNSNQNFTGRNSARAARMVPTVLLETPVVDAPAVASDETNQFSETPTEPSPREEESDGGSRIYMKPGSYSVPKKNNSPDDSPPSIEFFENVKNISSHLKKLEAKKKTDDKEWKSAVTASSNLIKKNGLFEDSIESHFSTSTAVVNSSDIDHVKRWLLHDHFAQQNLSYPLSDLRLVAQDRQQSQQQKGVEDATAAIVADVKGKLARKFASESPQQMQLQQQVRRSFVNKLERDYEVILLLLDELEKTTFNRILTEQSNVLQEFPESIENIIYKCNCKIYKDHLSVLNDLKKITTHAQVVYKNDADILKLIGDFCSIVDNCFERLFVDGVGANNEISYDLEGLD